MHLEVQICLVPIYITTGVLELRQPDLSRIKNKIAKLYCGGRIYVHSGKNTRYGGRGCQSECLMKSLRVKIWEGILLGLKKINGIP